VLLVTLRAHGDSSGERDDFGWSARHDVSAAVSWLALRRPESPLVVCGSSLGAAAATFAAAEVDAVDGYILECLYRDLDSAARRRAEVYLPPGLDWLAWAGLRVVAPLVLPHWRICAPIEAIARIPEGVPVLVLAGALDSRATPQDARALLACIAERAELVVLEGAGHDNLDAARPAEYERLAVGFLERAIAHRAVSAAPR
jgi:alpha-beta hydrolase superfamily lysophospholipase